jgi:hypothetical protein
MQGGKMKTGPIAALALNCIEAFDLRIAEEIERGLPTASGAGCFHVYCVANMLHGLNCEYGKNYLFEQKTNIETKDQWRKRWHKDQVLPVTIRAQKQKNC